MAKITRADYNDYRIIGVSSRDSILPRGRAWAVFDTDRNHDQINYRSNRIIGRFVERSPSLSLSLSPRFNGQRSMQRRRVYTLRVCRFLRKRIASRAPRFMGPWAG